MRAPALCELCFLSRLNASPGDRWGGLAASSDKQACGLAPGTLSQSLHITRVTVCRDFCELNTLQDHRGPSVSGQGADGG